MTTSNCLLDPSNQARKHAHVIQHTPGPNRNSNLTRTDLFLSVFSVILVWQSQPKLEALQAFIDGPVSALRTFHPLLPPAGVDLLW